MSNLGESAFARAVFSHDGVDLSLVNGEVNAVENLDVVLDDLGSKVIDLEEGSGSSGHADTVVVAAEGGESGSGGGWERDEKGRRMGW